MKNRFLLFILSLNILVIGILALIINLNAKRHLIVYSVDTLNKLDLGKYDITLYNKDVENGIYTYTIKGDADRFNDELKQSEVYILEKTIENKKYNLYLNDGYYYYSYIDGNKIYFNNMLSIAYGNYYLGFIKEEEKHFYTRVNKKDGKFYYKYNSDNLYEKLDGSIFFIDLLSKEEILSFYSKMNKNLGYVNDNIIYLRVYNQLLGVYSNGYPIELKINDGEIEFYGAE